MKLRTLGLGLFALSLLAPVLAEGRADAFCGFYVAPQDGPLHNDATMVALMREGTRTVMSMSNNYKGPAADFAMVVPVPVVLQKENVKTLPLDIFKKVEALTAPRLVEYWEQDPCYQEPPMPSAAPMAGGAGMKKPSAKSAEAPGNYGVKIEAQFKVGEYDIVVLSAKQSDGLEHYLLDNKYKIPKGASAALAPYVKEQWKFFVAKVDVKKVQMDAQGVAVLSPLRFHFESQDFRLPVRLGLLNANGRQDLLIYILSKNSRYDVANYANVFIPTNLEVSDDTRKSFGPFYAALFDEAVAKGGGRAVVTEYSWATSSCDPCPTPPLQQSDLATLGGDVLFGMGAPPPPPGPMLQEMKGPMPPGKMPPPMGKPMPKPMPPGGGWGGGFTPMVVTRLHTRYDATTLGDDLVFRQAGAVVGGREHVTGANGEIEKGAQPSSMNNFQARYVIRHAWTGPIKCKNPRRGVWGGPPGSGYGSSPPPPAPATNIAAAPRGVIKLASFLKKGMPAFDVLPAPSTLPALAPIAPPTEDAGAPVEDASIAAPPPGDASLPPAGAPTTVPSVEPKPGGCGCDVPGASSAGTAASGAVLAFGAFAALVVARRRRPQVVGR